MARINISGFYGFNNMGDEGILRAIIETLGKNNEYIISTSLPYNCWETYLNRMKEFGVINVRSNEDIRWDYDLYIQGGGGLSWCTGWKQMMSAVANNIPCVNYGVGYYHDLLYSERAKRLYSDWLSLFSLITVRDSTSHNLLFDELGVDNFLTGCPAINLSIPKEPPITSFYEFKDKVIICPRFEDWVPNTEQIKWIIKTVKSEKIDPRDIILIPFARYNLEGVPIDLGLCDQIGAKLGGCAVYQTSDPRSVKFAISKCSQVISGGRYHAGVWAIAHGKPFRFYPASIVRYPKIEALLRDSGNYETMVDMERLNKILLEKVICQK